MLEFLTTLSWNRSDVGTALGLDDDQLNNWARDGRNMNTLVQHRIASDQGWRLVSVEGGTKVLVSDDGRRYWVRCVNKNGVHLTRASMRGHGRSFKEGAFRSWLQGFDGFLLANVDDWPLVDVYHLSATDTLALYQAGVADDKAHLSFQSFLRLAEPDVEATDDAPRPSRAQLAS